ncbi:DUF6519 domain-containing protein [Streptomyces sp. NPDC006372]|uniref:DUF6519 domain-containing protein n=1 Tax=Streptomyces sp. NPDC006372 TaxID=3155599 RepID=UPI0033BA1F35
MAIDLSRAGHDRRKQYQGTRMQMGRVLLDDDLNTGAEIAEDDRRRALADVIGACGTPDGGFLPTNPVVGPDGLDFTLGAGILYLGGLRLETDGTETFRAQDDWLQQTPADRPGAPAAEGNARHDLVWIEAVLQDVTAVEDAELQDAALGAWDTSARTRVVRRVRITPDIGSARCEDGWARVVKNLGVGVGPDLEAVGDTTLTVGYDPAADTDSLCSPSVAGGYLGADNQAIRVQLVGDGHALTWGYDNSAPLYRAKLSTDAAGARTVVTLLTEPPDQAHWPTAGQVVELLPWAAVLPNGEKIAERTGLLARVQGSYDPDTLTLTLDTPAPADFGAAWRTRPDAAALGEEFIYLRVWNRGADTTSPLALTCPDGTAVPLAHTGLHVTVAGNRRTAGEHWIIAARPHTPTQVLPWQLEEGRPPHGFRRWVAPLGVIRWEPGAATGTLVDDCRPSFDPLTRLGGCCTHTVGDGVGSHGQFADIQHAIDRLPPEGGSVCVLPGRYVQRFEIRDRSGVTVHGCGPRTVIEAPDGDGPVVAVTDAQDITLESFTVESRDAVGIAVTDTSGEAVITSGITLRDLLVHSAARSAVTVNRVEGLRMLDCRVELRPLGPPFGTPLGAGEPGAGADPGVFVRGTDVLVEGCTITAPDPERSPGLFGGIRAVRLRLPLGGLQIGGGSRRVEIRRNRVEGGNGNGITLGSIVWVPSEDIRLLTENYAAAVRRAIRLGGLSVVVDESGCLHLKPGSPQRPPAGGPEGVVTWTPVAQGRVRDVRITGNRIAAMGGNGIATADYPPDTVGAGYLQDALVDDNRIESCLRIEAQPSDDPRSALGGITFGEAHTLTLRDNLVRGNGTSYDHPVCGVFVGAAETVIVENNQILNNGRWARQPVPGYRAGIAVRRATTWLGDVGADDERLEAPPAAVVRGNTVVHPSGRALLLIAEGAVSVTDNLLAGTALPQPQEVRSSTARLSTSAEVFRARAAALREAAALESAAGARAARDEFDRYIASSLGSAVFLLDATPSNPGGGGTHGARAAGPGFRLHAVGATVDRPFAAGAVARAAVEGAGPVLFAANRVRLDASEATAVQSTAVVAGRDDVGVADNLVESASLARPSFGSLLGGNIVRVTGNRLREAPGTAQLSALVSGTLNTTALNQSTHCIQVGGTLVVNRDNLSEAQLSNPEACAPALRGVDPARLTGARPRPK